MFCTFNEPNKINAWTKMTADWWYQSWQVVFSFGILASCQVAQKGQGKQRTGPNELSVPFVTCLILFCLQGCIFQGTWQWPWNFSKHEEICQRTQKGLSPLKGRSSMVFWHSLRRPRLLYPRCSMHGRNGAGLLSWETCNKVLVRSKAIIQSQTSWNL